MAISLEIKGDDKVMKRLVRAKVQARPMARRLERKWAFKMKAEVRRVARVFKDTGVYDKSIVVRNGNEVLTEHPAGPRLEKGFIGTDASGRTYAQAPRPHWRIAKKTIARQMAADGLKEVKHLGD